MFHAHFGVQVRVGKWLTDLEKNFYGSSLAYDKVRSFSSSSSDGFCMSVDQTHTSMM